MRCSFGLAGLDGRQPIWFSELEGSVMLALGGEPIEFVSLGGVEGDTPDSGHLSGVVVSERLVVALNASAQRRQDEADWNVTVRSLTRLQRMEVRATASPFAQGFEDQRWPGRPSLELHFDDGARVDVPAAGRIWRDDREPLVRLAMRLPGLLR